MSEAAASDPPRGNAGAARLLSDDRLARRAAKGDRHAFAAIYRRYHQDLYRFCLAIVGNPQDAQDALQNTMVKALGALPGEKREIRLKPWLYRIARNEAVELLRKRRDSAPIEPELMASADGEPAEAAVLQERLRRLFVDLAQLPERQRAALVMRELAGLGFGEIGAAFDTSDAVARQTVYEARLSLRQMEEGREMSCKKVMWALSETDGRVRRRRDIQAHLRSCPKCREFRAAIAGRRRDLAAIAPLPLAASAGLLQGLLGGDAVAAGAGVGAGAGSGAGGGLAGAAGTAAVGAGGGGGGGATAGAGGALTGAAAAGAGKAVATSAVLKAAATVAVVAAGATAADRGGLIETPLPSSIGGAKSSGSSPGAPAVGPRSDRGPAAGATGAAGPGRDEHRDGPGAKRGAQGEGGVEAAKGRDGPAGKGPGSAPGGNGANSRSQAQEHGRPDSLPAASGHGQKAAAGRSSRKSKSAKTRGAGSKGRGRAEGKSHPTRGSHAGGRGGRSGGGPQSGAKGQGPKQAASPPAPVRQTTKPPAAGGSTQQKPPKGSPPKG